MSGADFKLDGFENIVKIFREMPDDGYRKPVIAAFRKAAIPIKQAMIKNLPSSLSPLKKALKIQPGKGKSMTLSVGFFGRQGFYRNSKGQMWDLYMLLYWHNYGTLANRSAAHSFQNPRRKPSLNWKGGIKAGMFVDRAVEESISEAQKIFESAYLIEHEKFLEKLAAK
jgi:hypothetical protein